MATTLDSRSLNSEGLPVVKWSCYDARPHNQYIFGVHTAHPLTPTGRLLFARRIVIEPALGGQIAFVFRRCPAALAKLVTTDLT